MRKGMDLPIQKIIQSLSVEENLKEYLLNMQTHDYYVMIITDMIEKLFTDSMLYQYTIFKKMVLSSRNGWVKIDQILSLPKLKKALSEIDMFEKEDRSLLIKYILIHLRKQSKTLIVNKNSLRRIVPFVDRAKQVKPIFIEDFKKDRKMETIRRILMETTEIYKIKFHLRTNHEGEHLWAKVYAAEPDKIFAYFKDRKHREVQIQQIQQYESPQYAHQSQDADADKDSEGDSETNQQQQAQSLTGSDEVCDVISYEHMCNQASNTELNTLYPGQSIGNIRSISNIRSLGNIQKPFLQFLAETSLKSLQIQKEKHFQQSIRRICQNEQAHIRDKFSKQKQDQQYQHQQKEGWQYQIWREEQLQRYEGEFERVNRVGNYDDRLIIDQFQQQMKQVQFQGTRRIIHDERMKTVQEIQSEKESIISRLHQFYLPNLQFNAKHLITQSSKLQPHQNSKLQPHQNSKPQPRPHHLIDQDQINHLTAVMCKNQKTQANLDTSLNKNISRTNYETNNKPMSYVQDIEI